jgi:hypothetical protein
LLNATTRRRAVVRTEGANSACLIQAHLDAKLRRALGHITRLKSNLYRSPIHLSPVSPRQRRMALARLRLSACDPPE